jgi:hypothetical protein
VQNKAGNPWWHYLLLVPAFIAAAYMGFQIEARPGQDMKPEEGVAILVCFALPFGSFMVRHVSRMLTRDDSRAEQFGDITANVFLPIFGVLVAGSFLGTLLHPAMVRLGF